jgi:orotate phosphoribosyltransferase
VLAERLAGLDVRAVCGPLVEGAFVALLVANQLRVPFSYSAPVAKPCGGGLFPVAYQIPAALRAELSGKRVAVINDVINAGSAVAGTLSDLRSCGAEPVAIAALAVLGEAARELAALQGIRLEALAAFPNRIWDPALCPLCARAIPLSRRREEMGRVG